MLEQRRQQYLSLLGIDSYVPRRLLVKAAAPVLLSDEQIAPPSEVSASAIVGVDDNSYAVINSQEQRESSSPPLSSPISALNALVEPVVANTVADIENTMADDSNAVLDVVADQAEGDVSAIGDAIEKNREVIAATVSTASTKELSFVLNVWRIRDQLLVIDSRQPGAAYPTDRLLQNILRAIGYPLAQLPASEIIRWPLFINQKQKNSSNSIEQQNQDAEQACAMVQAYITAQMTRLPFKALLCMGDSAARFSLNLSSDTSEDHSLESDQWNIPVVTTPSLFSMLQEPLLKASAWSALQEIIVKKENP